MSTAFMRIATRRAGPADLDAVDRIESTAFTADRFSRRNLARMLASRSADVTLAEFDGRPAGYALVLFRNGSRVGRLYSIAVLPEFRGKGLADELMHAAFDCAITRGCDRMRLEVRAANAPAIRTYERAGFNLLKEMSGYYPDGETAFHMEKRIGAADGTNA